MPRLHRSPDDPLRVPPVVRATFNALAALTISYLFVVVLMAAAAQQRVSTRLAELAAPKLDYSSASLVLAEARGREGHFQRLASRRQGWIERRRKAEADADTAAMELDDSWDQIAPIVARGSGSCAATALPAGADELVARSARIDALRQCLQEGSLPAPLAAQLSRGKLFTDFAEHRRAARSAQARIRLAGRSAAELGDELKGYRGYSPRDVEVARSFAELNALGQTWLIGGSVLPQFPPSMLQIILAFSSGMFGALLVTLVLVVYPKNHFSLASHGHYGARTLLGGLIAICVYVVLSGGTAVLGTGSGFADGQANYMTFCAVGVLAGMFSDRVAAWLSDRATSFFRIVPPEEEATDTETRPA